MPNTGMLDHRAYHKVSQRRPTMVHWMKAWPGFGGYQTVHSLRVAHFSRHISSAQRRQSSSGMITSRPSTATLNNTICPFNTLMKPTCGYYFSRNTDNRKRCIGIPPSDLVSWRPVTSKTPRAVSAP